MKGGIRVVGERWFYQIDINANVSIKPERIALK